MPLNRIIILYECPSHSFFAQVLNLPYFSRDDTSRKNFINAITKLLCTGGDTRCKRLLHTNQDRQWDGDGTKQKKCGLSVVTGMSYTIISSDKLIITKSTLEHCLCFARGNSHYGFLFFLGQKLYFLRISFTVKKIKNLTFVVCSTLV